MNVGEAQVLEGAFRAWMDQLRAEAIRRADSPPALEARERRFQLRTRDAAADQFQALLRSYQLSSAEEIEAAARAVTAGLEKNPAALAVLRAASWSSTCRRDRARHLGRRLRLADDLITIFLFVSAAHQVVELIVRQYVEGKRSAIRSRKMATVSQAVSGPLADWLARWPATGGSAYEKLQAALAASRTSIAQLRRLAEQRLRS